MAKIPLCAVTGSILYCNAGEAIVNKKGDLKGSETVWYHPEGIAKILYLQNILYYKVTYDSSQGKGFIVYKADGSDMYLCLLARGYSSLMSRVILLTS